jgi:hypothetical protein
LRLPESWSLGQRPCGPLARLARLARRVRSHDRAGGSDGRTAPSQVGSALKACPALRAEPEIGKDAMTVYMVPQVQVQDQEHLGARQGDRRAGDRPVRRALPHARRQPRSGRSGLDPAGRPAGQHRRVPSLEQAHAWYDSPEYSKALAFRKQTGYQLQADGGERYGPVGWPDAVSSARLPPGRSCRVVRPSAARRTACSPNRYGTAFARSAPGKVGDPGPPPERCFAGQARG